MAKKLLSMLLALVMLASLMCVPASAEGMADGTYTGVGTGLEGEIQVEITVKDNAITAINVLEDNETAGVGAKALGIIADEVVENQSLAVDSVSGATLSSAGMKSAIADAITNAGGDASEWQKREIEVISADETYDYDIVVVGAGLSGLTAAVTAEMHGANVAILEKQGIVGGTSVFSSGNFLAASTEDQIEAVAETWNKRNKLQEENPVNMDKVNSLLSVSPEVVAMYEEIGVDFTYDEETYTLCPVPSEKSIENCSTIQMADAAVKNKGCEALISSLETRLMEDGVDIYLNTPATSLIQSEDGTVTGVIAETKTGTKTFNAKAVILATGDYARNDEINAEIAPETVGEYTATAVSNTGDGLVMALEAGAVLHDYQESLSGNFNADPYDMPVVGQPNNQFPYAVVLVDRDGERKVSEAAGPHDQQVFFIHEDDVDYAWAIMDQEIAERFINLDTYLEKTANGSTVIQAYKADSIEALAELIDVDADALTATINHYNELCAAGEDTDFGKKADYLQAIDDGTYYAVKEYDMTRGNYGGILTSDSFEVIDEDGNAIPGLYAVGMISSGDYFGDYYPGREALSLDAHAGYIAAIDAAAAATAVEGSADDIAADANAEAVTAADDSAAATKSAGSRQTTKSAGSDTIEATLTIVNDLDDLDITELYMGYSSDTTWGDDLLDADGLEAGYYIKFGAHIYYSANDTFDMKVVFSNGQDATFAGFDFASISEPTNVTVRIGVDEDGYFTITVC